MSEAFICSSQCNTGSLDVFSCGTGLPGAVHDIGLSLDHVFSSDKLLQLLPSGRARRHSLSPSPGDVLNMAINLARDGARVGILSSGDALYHGLGSTLVRILEQRFPGITPDRLPFTLTFHPGITAFQALCHRAGVSWSDAELFCAHKAPIQPWRVLGARTAIVYAGLPLTASTLAAQLLEHDPSCSQRACLVAENLGSTSERLFRCTLGEAAGSETGPTSILVLLPGGHKARCLPLGLSDEHFRFERHCLTSRYIRPVVLSCLRLPDHGVLWDLGAGSGSVGLEAALLQKNLTVCAVEQYANRCKNIEINAARLGAPNLKLIRGDIVQVMPGLPDPDRIFAGGGGSALPQILEQGLARLDPDDPDAVLVATAITMESVARLTQFDKGTCLEALSLDIAVRSPMVAGKYSHLAPLHRIHVFTFRPGR